MLTGRSSERPTHAGKMNTWQESLLCALHSAHDAEEVFSILEKEGRKLGFDHLAYGIRYRYPLSNPRSTMLNNYPERWKAIYLERDYIKIDPIVMRGMISQIPIIWSEHQTDALRNFWEEAQSFGIDHGWSKSSVDRQGAQSLISFVRACELIGPDELSARAGRLSYLADAGHEFMRRALSKKGYVEDIGELSPREIEVLRWTAEAKTSSEISILTGISERTVNFHAHNAMVKLNCANKTAAAVKAAILGLLD